MSGFEPAEPVVIDPHAASVQHAGGAPRPAGGRRRCADARRLFRLRFTRCGAARVAASRADPSARRRATGDAGAAGAARRRAPSGPVRPDPVAAGRGADRRGAALGVEGDDAPPGLLRGLSDPRLAAAIRHIHGAPARPWTMAGTGEGGGAVALGLLRPFRPDRGRAADGVSARLADEPRQGPAAPQGGQARRDRGARRLWIGERVQHRLCPPCRGAAETLCDEPLNRRRTARPAWRGGPSMFRQGRARCAAR